MANLYEFTQTLNVLIIEDDERVLAQLEKFFLRRFKYVDTARNGKEAYEMYLQKLEDTDETYDFIFSDICMPQMDGLELLKKIRMSDKDISIVFATARNESHRILEAINYGVNGYLVKPLDYDLLSLKIKEVTSDIFLKRQYEKTKAQNKHYKEVLNETAYIAKVNTQGKITFVNDKLCQYLGYTQEELLGENHLVFKHPDVSESYYLEMISTLTCGNVWQGELKKVTKEGLLAPCNTKIIPLYDDSYNQIVEYVAISYSA